MNLKGKLQKCNPKRGLLFSLTFLSVVRCPCCGSPFCVNNLPFIVGSFLMGSLLPGRKKEKEQK